MAPHPHKKQSSIVRYIFGVAMPGQAQKHKGFAARVENLSVVNLEKKNYHFSKEYPSTQIRPIYINATKVGKLLYFFKSGPKL